MNKGFFYVVSPYGKQVGKIAPKVGLMTEAGEILSLSKTGLSVWVKKWYGRYPQVINVHPADDYGYRGGTFVKEKDAIAAGWERGER